MFSTLRIAAIVGVIYYLSPVRNEDARAGVEHVVAWGKGLVLPTREPSREATQAERLEALWKALPEEAKQAAIDRVMAEAGRHLQSPAEPARPEPVHPVPRPVEPKKVKP